ncbi:MAG: hypothetical protein KVP17_000192 [Porospora cf. gigantea B]|nr:MAG: hypothetical protein KVP17_000192 [Porospora cf. gigantea B]
MMSGIRIDNDLFQFDKEADVMEYGPTTRQDGNLLYPSNFFCSPNPKDGKGGDYIPVNELKSFPLASEDTFEISTGQFRIVVFGRPFFLTPEVDEMATRQQPEPPKKKKSREPVPFFYMKLQSVDTRNKCWVDLPKETQLGPFAKRHFGEKLLSLQALVTALSYSEPFNDPDNSKREEISKALTDFRTNDQPLIASEVEKEVMVGAVEATIRKIRSTGARLFLPGSAKDALGNSSFDKLGGAEEQKKKVHELINATFISSDITAKVYEAMTGSSSVKVPKIVMFTGPPGVGKTEMTKAVAQECKVPLILVETSQVMDMWVGSGEKKIATIWEGARNLAKMVPEYQGCLIVIDEIEAIVPKRNGPDVPVHATRMVSTILQMVQGTLDDSSTMLVCCTNYPGNIDDAFMSRVSEMVKFGLPSEADRADIFRKKLTASYEPYLEEMAKKSVGFSGRDIQNVVDAAGRRRVHEVTDVITRDGKDAEKSMSADVYNVPHSYLLDAIDVKNKQRTAADSKKAADNQLAPMLQMLKDVEGMRKSRA